MHDLAPVEVKERVAETHRSLRAAMAFVRSLVEDEEACSVLGGLVDGANQLVGRVRAQLEMEDLILAPTLRDADAWGAVRAAKLCADHARLQRELDRVCAVLSEPSLGCELVRNLLRSFLDELARRMDDEDREILYSDVLRDDTVNPDTFSG